MEQTTSKRGYGLVCSALWAFMSCLGFSHSELFIWDCYYTFLRGLVCLHWSCYVRNFCKIDCTHFLQIGRELSDQPQEDSSLASWALSGKSLHFLSPPPLLTSAFLPALTFPIEDSEIPKLSFKNINFYIFLLVGLISERTDKSRCHTDLDLLKIFRHLLSFETWSIKILFVIPFHLSPNNITLDGQISSTSKKITL